MKCTKPLADIKERIKYFTFLSAALSIGRELHCVCFALMPPIYWRLSFRMQSAARSIDGLLQYGETLQATFEPNHVVQNFVLTNESIFIEHLSTSIS